MTPEESLANFKDRTRLRDRYAKQLARLQRKEIATACIEETVEEASANLETAKERSLVIYGDPQSGKTEMMICLTGRLLDSGHRTIIHLMNDSVDLLNQNLRRFKEAGLAPAAKSSFELAASAKVPLSQEMVVLCKKNATDLGKLIESLEGRDSVVVIDDEADYATPNSKVNKNKKTKINALVEQVIGANGFYIGVTATPARLDLNNTLRNETEKWVRFRAHPAYTGPDVFFSVSSPVDYRLRHVSNQSSQSEAFSALIRFAITVGYLNSHVNGAEEYYTLLMHTSGNKSDHAIDRSTVQGFFDILMDDENSEFNSLVEQIRTTAPTLYPRANVRTIIEYVIENASRASIVVLNSERDRKLLGDRASEPTVPFTVIIGGNIVSRGVTFPNLLSMFFTRNVRGKLQQDTYIQRARMFGARGRYLEHFELTIPAQLYQDWHRCFVYHRLSLETILAKLGSPVWIGDSRISQVSNASIDRATVSTSSGEMGFGLFDFSTEMDTVVKGAPEEITTLESLHNLVGQGGLPSFLIKFIAGTARGSSGELAIHESSSIAGSSDAIQETISRAKGFLGQSQLEPRRFPNAQHHVKIFHNNAGKARLFYKYTGSVNFLKNSR
ncbi:Z1 domain-containing protein [Acidicapsa acidisoli]|uniref:Z1 domain-containing protein n=1 Tax=Acidicapsa acidisoli TaxID=1615681 RepID=UPI0021E0ABCE|nr:Z1 domain-containing protein [Acidicapsa acidisoli]